MAAQPPRTTERGTVHDLGVQTDELDGLVKRLRTMGVWIHIHEISDGNWGAAGQVIMFAQLREAAKQAQATAG